jgi:acylphosphatase
MTHGLTGFEWNRTDDAVELIAEGDDQAVDALGDWLARGPRLARVEHVERSDLDGERRYQDFSIAYAAPE